MAIDSPQRQTGRFESRSRLLGSDFLFIRVCLWAFLLWLDAESPVVSPYFLFRLYSRSMSPIKNPGELPHVMFSGDPHKASNPRTNRGIHSMRGYLESEMESLK